MNKFAYRQNALVGFVGVGDVSGSNGVVCPKPRRGALFNSASVQAVEPIITAPPLLQINKQETEGYDLKAGTELLDIIITKGRYYVDYSNFQLDPSPPFFCGSPPTRASNPLIQDAQFGNNFLPIPELPAPSPPPFSSSSSSHVTGGGCVRVKFGNNSTPVRIEGFNCRGSCSISAVA